MDLDAYRARAQAFATELNRAHLERFAGLTAAWDPRAIHARHAALWSDEAIDGLREAGTRRLLRFAVEARLGEATAGPEEARARAEAQEGVADLTAALAAEPDPAARAALEERRLDAVARRLTAPAAEAVERVRAGARELGWPSARAMWSELLAADLGALAAAAEDLLRAPPPVLPEWVRARHDLPRLRARPARDDALPRLDGVLTTLGLEPRFVLDVDPRPGKSPRAFCAAVAVPREVHLVVVPGDVTALFHEAGHALDLTHRPAGAPFEDRHLADRAGAEAIAFLFEEAAGAEPDPLRTRLMAAAFLHDLDVLDEGPAPALRERYARRMARAAGVAWPSAPWLANADPLLASADYLRALGRARELSEGLGPAWWERPESGEPVRALLGTT